MKNNKTLYNKAFTLIELLVVIAIISLLSALALNSLASARMKANDTKIAEDLRQFRIAAELYYNDNHAYPPGYTPVANLNRQNTITQTTHSWSNKLSFFVKTAEAAINHQTPLCANFDAMATEMVSKKYLAAVPVHPYDDDAEGICYKAINATSTYTAYAALTTQVSIGGENFNKRTGFILGDTSPAGLSAIVTATNAVNQEETAYPTDSSGGLVASSNISSSADSIMGITSGASGIQNGLTGIVIKVTSSISSIFGCTSGQALDISTGACRDLFTGTRVVSVLCLAPSTQDPFSDNCVTGIGGSIGSHPINTFGCTNGYNTVSGICVSTGQVAGTCPSGTVFQSGDLCYTPSAGCPGSTLVGACPPDSYKTYQCLMGKEFLVNGLERTINGTCVY